MCVSVCPELPLFAQTRGARGGKFVLSDQAPAKRQSPEGKKEKTSHADIIGVLKAAQAACDRRYVSWGSGLRDKQPFMGGGAIIYISRHASYAVRAVKKKRGGVSLQVVGEN